MLPGKLTLRRSPETPLRAEGAVVETAGPERPATVLLRLVPREISVTKFRLLNAQVERQAAEISRRQRSEAALAEQRRLLEVTLASIGDAVIATDERGRVTFLNAVAESLTGWQQAEARGRHLSSVSSCQKGRTIRDTWPVEPRPRARFQQPVERPPSRRKRPAAAPCPVVAKIDALSRDLVAAVEL